MTNKLILDDIILVGRRFEEYNLMFNLSELNLGKERILDVAAGVSSFGMEAQLAIIIVNNRMLNILIITGAPFCPTIKTRPSLFDYLIIKVP